MLKNSGHTIGIDIGGTKLSVVLADGKAALLRKIKEPTHADKGPQYVIAKIIEMAQAILAQSGLTVAQVSCLGVSCPGPVDPQTGAIFEPPNLPGWKDIPLKKILEERLHIPARFENDANAAALAEYYYGAGQGCHNMVYLTMSTGIGGGLILDGRLYRGSQGMAGEVGHQTLLPYGPLCGCGKRGCLEALCSGTGLTRWMREEAKVQPDSLIYKLVKGDLGKLSPVVLIKAAQAGDKLALDIWNQAGFFLGWGLANLVNVLNPDIIILGTIAIHAGELLLAPTRRSLTRHVLHQIPLPPIVTAKLGDNTGDYGAIAICHMDE